MANSLFNLIYCLLKPLTLINICIFPNSSFCSSIYRLEATQYLKIYFTNFFGNSLRLCCNASYICFSLSRYFKATSSEARFFKKFQKLNIKLFYVIILGLSFGASSFYLFKYKPNEFDGLYDSNYPIDVYGYNYCENNIAARSSLSSISFKCGLFKFFTMLNNVLNNILFFFISVFIDVGLVHFSNQNVKRRRAMAANEAITLNNNNNTSNNPLQIHEDAHLIQALKLKEKINKMIINNGLLFFISHFPDFIVTILLLIYSNQLEYACFFVISCIDLSDMAQVFNFFSITCQFFIFIRFDKNFRLSLKSLRLF